MDLLARHYCGSYVPPSRYHAQWTDTRVYLILFLLQPVRLLLCLYFQYAVAAAEEKLGKGNYPRIHNSYTSLSSRTIVVLFSHMMTNLYNDAVWYDDIELFNSVQTICNLFLSNSNKVQEY